MRASGYCVVAALIAGGWAGVAAARFANPTYLPVDRLIENTTAYIQEHPQDASGYYILGRIHYLAFVNRSFLAAAYGNYEPPHVVTFSWRGNYLQQMRNEEAQRLALEELGYASTRDVPEAQSQAFWARVSSYETKLAAEDWQPPQPTEEQLVAHAGAAQWNFIKAITLDPNNALYYLGQASLGEQYLDYLQAQCPAVVPSTVKSIILDGIRQTYFTAYQLAIDKDLSLTRRPLEGLAGLIGYEAGGAYVRLWEAEGQVPAEIQERIAGIKADMEKLETLPPGAVTPIVFSLKPGTSLATLLAPRRIVRFDLDGDGVAELRPWLKPTTGLLVWDGDRDGKITSGRELFGSVTWRLFFSNGYRALDLLDDNRDGYLTAGELRGIAVWFDRNSNGRSDRGEIVSLEGLGVTALGTRPTGCDGSSPMHASGVRLRDGRTLPSYDWIAPAVRPAPPSRR